ncbi:hypothetical protein HXX76_013924 [Chlamydomonas incerta]|uniref:Protein kinase domain-containing protein n=1 Tax=Chlamydomonas incerta TaxID=51695 RepID=A0A835VRJ8_CHLIN|nr:hypothetical protein HXX76_013924 [Chlamydomonas incerta]|eukprot:KAG2425170.1 hypothetical protein HXX76_013924 [Chlamydomonas incerta]
MGQASASNLGAGLAVTAVDALDGPGEAATELVEEAALLFPFCFPADLLMPYLRDSPRPPEAPGVNAFSYPTPLPEPLRYSPGEGGGDSSSSSGGGSGCSNSTVAPLYERCYSQVGTYVDYAGRAVIVRISDSKSSSKSWQMHNVTSLCLYELDRACVEQLTPIGCLQYSYSAYFGGGLTGSNSSTGSGGLMNGTNVIGGADGASGGGGGTDSAVVAIVCGAVIGGCAFVLLGVAVVMLARHQRRQRQQRLLLPGAEQLPNPKLEPQSSLQSHPAHPSDHPSLLPLEPCSDGTLDDSFAHDEPAAAVLEPPPPPAAAGRGPSSVMLVMEGCCSSSQCADVLGSGTHTPVTGAAFGSSCASAPSAAHPAMAVAGTAAPKPGVGAGAGMCAAAGAQDMLQQQHQHQQPHSHCSECSRHSQPGVPPPPQQQQQGQVVTLRTPPAPGLALLLSGPETAAEQQLRAAAAAASAGQSFVASAPPMHGGCSAATAAVAASHAAALPLATDGLGPSDVALSTHESAGIGAVEAAEDAAAGADFGVTLLPNAILGKGSFGRVYEGRYRGQHVAVKVALTCGPAASAAAAAAAASATDVEGLDCWEEDDCAVQSLRQEMEVLARCAHPNVVKVLAMCLTPPRLCLVMELMETNLYRLLHRGNIQRFGSGGLLPMSMVFDVAIGVARALEYLHPTITHRDLKPANVLIRGLESGRLEAKLADFGIARLRHTLQATASPEMGTPGYTAPECFDTTNWVVSHHADMYSFGVLLWEMLTGLEPWKGAPLVAIAYRIVHHREILPTYLIPERRSDGAGRAAVRLEALVLQCFELDPLRRPAAAEAVKRLLLAREEWAAASAAAAAATATAAATAGPASPPCSPDGGGGSGSAGC